ncbi:MAG TPA: hypothetical protein DEP53_15765 [Bacteroidetes bacterium]|nr:hypothetical protein [Bacteroidota bacterium]
MISDSEKKEILTEILESPEFKESKRFQELLGYLFEETIAGQVPKEITIAMQFFGKDSSFDPKEDPTVRVYLNNLRKKLEHFYFTTQTYHPYKLTIPKGHYQVEFVAAGEKPSLPGRIPLSLVAASAIFVLIAFAAGYLIRGPGSDDILQETASPIWQEFVAPHSRPTLILLGDFFFLYERHRDGTPGNFVRDMKINTPDDYRQAIKQDPSFARRYVQSDFTYLRPSASWGLNQILPILQQSGNGYSLKLASQFTVDDLKSNNVVFLGSFKTLYSLHTFLHVFGLDYTIAPGSFRVRGESGDSVKSFSPTDLKGGSYEKDFAVVAKARGPEGSTIMLLLGFADSGVIEASRAATDAKMLETIRTRYKSPSSSDPFFFTLVVETEGVNQAIFESHVRHFVRHTSTTQPANEDPSDTSRSR